MKVLGLVGSPRKGSNTDFLVDAFLEGAVQSGHSVRKTYLYDIEIAACIDCRACKKGKHQCVLNDGMSMLYPLLEEAAVIVFGTPLYWYGSTAKMKLLLDRLRPFVESKKLDGKKAILIVPSEEGPDACAHIVGMFKLSFNYLGIELISVLLPKGSERCEIKTQPNMISKAKRLGQQLE